MNRHVAKWTVALLLSAVLHAGAAMWFGPAAETIAVAGGAQAEIAMLGSAFQDAVSAGEAAETVQPVISHAEPVSPVEPESPSARVQQAQPPVATEPANEAPAKPAQASEVANIGPAEGDIAIAALQPSAAQPGAAQRGAPPVSAAIEPATMEETLTPETAPRPTPRPVRQARVEQPVGDPKQRREQPMAESANAAGKGGAAKENKHRGTAEGAKQARAASSGNTGRSREAGNAVVSNYPGKVFAKLRRSLRYPREARSKRIRGEVHVRFTVSRAGGVGSIGVARSSGSPLLDNAALETVRRAAPFPAIPAEAGRSSWSFTVPLAFTR